MKKLILIGLLLTLGAEARHWGTLKRLASYGQYRAFKSTHPNKLKYIPNGSHKSYSKVYYKKYSVNRSTHPNKVKSIPKGSHRGYLKAYYKKYRTYKSTRRR